MAGVCVAAAKMDVDLLPDQHRFSSAYQFGPWWALIHHLLHAFAVRLLSRSRSPATHEDNMILARYCMGIIRWLRAMEDPHAQRAKQAAARCYEIVAIPL
jgi:hypothetical protein